LLAFEKLLFLISEEFLIFFFWKNLHKNEAEAASQAHRSLQEIIIMR